MFRRIAAACALFAVMAMGFAAPAETGVRLDGSAASAGSLDAALVVVSARRRGTGPEIDGRSSGRGHSPLDLFHPPWLTAAAPSTPPPAIACAKTARAPSRAPSALLLASRTSRGPPPRS